MMSSTCPGGLFGDASNGRVPIEPGGAACRRHSLTQTSSSHSPVDDTIQSNCVVPLAEGCADKNNVATTPEDAVGTAGR